MTYRQIVAVSLVIGVVNMLITFTLWMSVAWMSFGKVTPAWMLVVTAYSVFNAIAWTEGNIKREIAKQDTKQQKGKPDDQASNT